MQLSDLKQPCGWARSFPCLLWNKSLQSSIWWPELVLILPDLGISSLWSFHQDFLSKLVIFSNFYCSFFLISILSIAFAAYIYKNHVSFLLVISLISRTENSDVHCLVHPGSWNPGSEWPVQKYHFKDGIVSVRMSCGQPFHLRFDALDLANLSIK